MNDWAWATGTPAERAQMVRGHKSLTREQTKELFHLTDEGLNAILAGDIWRQEHEAPSVNLI